MDGQDEPTKFLIGDGTEKASLGVLKTVFNVNRVRLRFESDGDSKRLIAIERIMGRPTGVVTGEVIKVYNNFWVAIKPKDGPPDGYAITWPPEKAKASAEVLKSLNPGDTVTIHYGTDERHRILQIEVKPAAK